MVSVLVLGGAQTAATAGTTPAPIRTRQASRAPAAETVSLAATNRGRILVGPGGNTLYAFSRDTRDRDRCQGVPGCLQAWPALVAHGRVHAGRGVRASLLATAVEHGLRQVTYAGHPLYTFTADGGPASTEYIGVAENGGTWPALTAAGRLVN